MTLHEQAQELLDRADPADVAAMLARLAVLEAWRESALLTLCDWDAVADKVPQKPANLGRPKSAVVGEYLDALQSALAAAKKEAGR